MSVTIEQIIERLESIKDDIDTATNATSYRKGCLISRATDGVRNALEILRMANNMTDEEA